MIHSGTQTEVRKHRRRDEHTPNRDEMLEKNYRGGRGSIHLPKVLQTTNAPVGTGSPWVTF